MQGPAFGKGRIRRMLETRRARTTRKRPIEAYHWRLLIIGRFELADTVTNGSWQDEGGILQKGPVTSERGQYPLSNAIPWLGFLFEAMAAPAVQIHVRCDVMHLWRLSPLSTRSSKIYSVLEPLLHRAVHTSP